MIDFTNATRPLEPLRPRGEPFLVIMLKGYGGAATFSPSPSPVACAKYDANGKLIEMLGHPVIEVGKIESLEITWGKP